ncbi:MAG: hypothetical protein ACTSU5_03670 [Promethearchaeota archaeon]
MPEIILQAHCEAAEKISHGWYVEKLFNELVRRSFGRGVFMEGTQDGYILLFEGFLDFKWYLSSFSNLGGRTPEFAKLVGEAKEGVKPVIWRIECVQNSSGKAFDELTKTIVDGYSRLKIGIRVRVEGDGGTNGSGTNGGGLWLVEYPSWDIYAASLECMLEELSRGAELEILSS